MLERKKYIITENTVKELFEEYFKKIGKEKKKKEKDAFWKYMKNESVHFTREFKSIKNPNNAHYWQFDDKEKFEEIKKDLSKYIDVVYYSWNEKYAKKRQSERTNELENVKVTTNFSNIKVPKLDTAFRGKKGTTLAVLKAIIDYCKEFTKPGALNIVEQIFVNDYINPLYDFCLKSFKEYEKSKKNIFNFRKSKKLKLEIVDALCKSNELALARVVQIPTRLNLLCNEIKKAAKIESDAKKTTQLENIYKELIKLYGPIVSKKKFVDERYYIIIRRATRLFLENMEKNGVGEDFTNFSKLLLESCRKKEQPYEN